MAYTNSSLVSYTKLSPNHSGQRTHSIDRITPHCVVGQCSVETLGNIFLPTSRQASSNYGIGVDDQPVGKADDVLFKLLVEVFPFRTRADKAHLALQNVPELR